MRRAKGPTSDLKSAVRRRTISSLKTFFRTTDFDAAQGVEQRCLDGCSGWILKQPD